jgi:hypothetical protein
VCDLAVNLRHPKVTKLGHTMTVNNDVVKLDVAVHNANRVQKLDPVDLCRVRSNKGQRGGRQTIFVKYWSSLLGERRLRFVIALRSPRLANSWTRTTWLQGPEKLRLVSSETTEQHITKSRGDGPQ